MLPKEFENNMKSILKNDYDAYIKALELPSKRGLIVNTNFNNSTETIKKYLKLNKIDFTPNGYTFNEEDKLGNTWFHHAGLIYLQEPSSMAPPLCFETLKGKKVLDLCASPGGKTIALSLQIGDDGLLVSNEIVPQRAKILFSNVERLALTNVVVTNNSPQELADVFNDFFDAILVDAPCSGEGMFRKDKNAINEWYVGCNKMCADRQKEILNNATRMLKLGGQLVYSTCTFNKQENEDIVEYIISLGFEILRVNSSIKNCSRDGIKNLKKDNLQECRRFYPMDNVGEGQFMALLKKCKNNDEVQQILPKNCKIKQNKANNIVNLNRTEQKIVTEFLNDTLQNLDCIKNYKIFNIGENVFLVKNIDLINLPLKFLSVGVNLGKLEKIRIEPHHYFFKVFGKNFKRQLKLNEQQVKDFIAGKELESENCNNGYASVLYCGFILGGGKIANGKLKNYYPKGLRAII